MNWPAKFALCAVFFLFLGCGVKAQQFRSHAVKQGETLSSISREYGVSVDQILRYNKELDRESTLKPNTILVIPAQATVATVSRPEISSQDTIGQLEPVSFKTHRVRKKETLFGITQRYEIEEAELKRYNPELYSKDLQRGMVLRIPVYPEGYREELELEAQLGTYVVKPQETRWSIAHDFGISMDSLLSLNPELPRSTSYLAIGQELRVPVKPGETIENQQTQIYISYTVPPQKTLFSLSQEYGISREEIVRLNPEIMDRGGLQEGMEIRLPEKPVQPVNTEDSEYLFYEVKPKQTEFSLTRKFGIGWAELVALNPDLRLGLKAGMVLRIPGNRAEDLAVKNEVVLDQFNLKDSINPMNVPKLLVLFPFRLDRLNLQDEKQTGKRIENNNALKYSLGLYSGMLVAMDSLREMGVSAELIARDTRLKTEHVRSLMLSQELSGLSAIVGPLEPQSIREVAARASELEIPVIAPTRVSVEVPEENIFYTFTSDQRLRRTLLDYVEGNREEQKILIISDQESLESETQILERFPDAELVDLRQEEENISLNVDDLYNKLSEEKENWVFVETDNFKIASSVVSILNSANSDTTAIRMLTTNGNRIYDNPVISPTHLSNLKFTFPSVNKEEMDPGFIRRYRRRFGGEPDRFAARGFDLAMDLVLRLAYKPDLFEVADQLGELEYSANRFNYVKPLQSGYFNMSSYVLMYSGLRIVEVDKP